MNNFPGCGAAEEWKGWPAAGTPFHSDHFVVEPKLDGYRLNVVIDAAGEISLHCRDEGSPDWAENLEHIVEAVRALNLTSVMLDGEVMAKTWNATSSLLRQQRRNMDEATRLRTAAELVFHVFDFVNLEQITEVMLPRRRKPARVFAAPLHERHALLHAALRGASPMLRHVHQFIAKTPAELETLFQELLDMEYEGGIVKHPSAPYVLDRHHYWLKMKPTKTIELRVTGSEVGLGKISGKLGALLCVDSQGREVRVGGGFTDELRADLWARRDSLVGLEVEVKAQAGDVAVARHPVFVRFRTEKAASL